MVVVVATRHIQGRDARPVRCLWVCTQLRQALYDWDVAELHGEVKRRGSLKALYVGVEAGPEEPLLRTLEVPSAEVLEEKAASGCAEELDHLWVAVFDCSLHCVLALVCAAHTDVHISVDEHLHNVDPSNEGCNVERCTATGILPVHVHACKPHVAEQLVVAQQGSLGEGCVSANIGPFKLLGGEALLDPCLSLVLVALHN
mmetsp:Transcript_16773/g.65512  ORF Transcript_16773/g.65512 Transcript_16773/m.65512 type:complete len:201 (-) Transcript_16773:94-696(-)